VRHISQESRFEPVALLGFVFGQTKFFLSFLALGDVLDRTIKPTYTSLVIKLRTTKGDYIPDITVRAGKFQLKLVRSPVFIAFQ